MPINLTESQLVKFGSVKLGEAALAYMRLAPGTAVRDIAVDRKRSINPVLSLNT